MEDKTKNRPSVDVDEMLADVRGFGLFHYIQFVLIGLPVAFTSIQNANFVFAAGEIDYRCLVPECESDNIEFSPFWWPNTTDYCMRPRPLSKDDNFTCTADGFMNLSEPCSKFIYEDQTSIVQTFDLACKPWLRTIVGTVHNLGLVISMPVLGFIADRYGRKISLIISAVGGAMCGMIKTFSVNYSMYLTFECLEAIIGGAIFTTSFVMLVEIGGKDKRVFSSAYVGFYICLGEVLLGMTAQAVSDWKTLIRITYGPALFFILYIFLVTESPRWLILTGKTQKAKEAIEKIAKFNKVKLCQKRLDYLNQWNSQETSYKKQIKISHLFSSKIILQRLAIASFWWLSASFVYYGLMINSVNLPGNKFLNFILVSAVGFPGEVTAMFALSLWGRRSTCIFAFVFCGFCCIASGFIPSTLTWLNLAIFLLGKMAASAVFNGIYIYSSELFPTNMRSSLIGCCSMFARMGSIAAPQTPLLESIFHSLPLLLFGGFAIVAGALMTLTPETLNKPLPDTVEDIETLQTNT